MSQFASGGLTHLGDCLAGIEAGLQELGRHSAVAALAPGLSERDVRDGLDGLGLVPSSELVELYAWHNGTTLSPQTPVDDVHMFPGFYLVPLEDALANLVAFRLDSRWDASWLPIFANGGGDFYVSDLSRPAGPVRHFRVEEYEHPIEFSSIGSMFATIHAAIHRGVFFIDDDGYLEMLDLAFGDLAAEIDPSVEWWSR